MRRAGNLPWILCAGLVLASPDLAGQGSATQDAQEKAKQHFFKGKLLVEEGDFEKAVVELKASYQLNPLPVVVYNIAWCYDQLHRYADALEYYRLYLQEGEDAAAEVEKVQKRIEALSQFIGTMIIEVDVDGAEVFIDGKLAGTTPLGDLTVDTGDHDLVVRKTGYLEARKQVTVVSGATKRISIVMFEAVPAEAPAAAKAVDEGPGPEPEGKKKKVHRGAFAATLTLTGLSAAALIATGTLALKKNSEIRDMSPADPGLQEAKDERTRLALATDIMIGVTAAWGLTSIVLAFFTDWKKEKSLSVRLSPAPGGAAFGLAGTF
jgi:tetratricopeptide (TPR) repeat protein